MLAEAEMDISLEDARPLIIGALLAVLLVGPALSGHGVSPVEAGRPQLLTPERGPDPPGCRRNRAPGE